VAGGGRGKRGEDKEEQAEEGRWWCRRDREGRPLCPACDAHHRGILCDHLAETLL